MNKIIETVNKFYEEIAETNTEMEITINALKLIKKEMDKEAVKFTESNYEYQPPKLQISFNGNDFGLPINDAEIFNALQDCFTEIIEDIEANYNV